MTSSVAPGVAWSIIVVSYIVVAMRLVWFDTGVGERRISAVLALAATGCVLRERATQGAFAALSPDILSVDFTRQLSTTVIVLAMAPFFIVVLSWTLRNKEPAWLSTAVYAAALTFVPMMLLLGANARSRGEYIDRTEGWQTIGYFAMFAVWVGGMAAVLLRTCVSELRTGNLAPRHVVSYLGIGAIGLWAAEEAISILTSAVFASLGIYPSFVELRFALNESNFVLMVGLGAVCASLPACAAVLEHFGWDRTTRDIKALGALWRDLTVACLEVRYTGDTDTEAMSRRRRLHRMTIEIRDAILILRHFTSCEPAVYNRALRTAIALHDAAISKSAGAPPGTPSTVIVLKPKSGDETKDLKQIAAQWERAQSFQALAAISTPTTSTLMVEGPT
ncbi:hypothetical protein HQO27_01745 [Rhodococcus fascians]|nr:hypothetical protein [Rhodococcus fascians]MBY4237821.1 hypothetical protein [Rhodococcus fascians]MBY4253428.1 hypothetical protein [Rhodococcus fascians]MBY4269065.1 hypothetical protein [Rhodococcus fascians]MBY4275120.1 hypothetical protein [Rhodococcus fascians]